MREIGFRARHKETGEWYYGSSLYTNFKTPSDYILPLGAFWQQVQEGWLDIKTIGEWTGLKDKNGIEIYEGDIIQWWNKVTEPQVVEATDGGWNPFIDDCQTDGSWHYIVIGNIHENPELKGVE